MALNRSDIEIMAPAGSWESLAAAVNAGADSVYFGIEQLNMRAKSSNNFTIEDLHKIVGICNQNNMRSYLTMNTIVYDHDINLMKRIIDNAQTAGITAIIAADQAVINYAWSKKVELHISTQSNVSNIEAVKFYANFADVIVTARELSLKQVKQITKTIEDENITGPSGELLQIEIFAHGALCMAVSGKCYLSLHEQNSSANRGACLQTCRKEYIVTEKETGFELEIDNEYIMSPKDLSTIGFIDQIIDAGVRVLKIEGRARPAEYVKKVVTSYREAVDAVFDGTFTTEKVDGWNKELSTVFNRGFWDGYYLGRKLGEWSKDYGSVATKQKQYVGRGSKYFSKIGVGEFKLEAGELKVGDQVLISGPTSGAIETVIESLHGNNGPVDSVKKGDVFAFKVPEKIRPSDKLYKITDTQFAKDMKL